MTTRKLVKQLTSTLLISLVCNIAYGQTKKEVLFLGNSYTYFNTMPKTVEQIALSKGDTLITDQNTPGGYTLQGHSTNSTSISKINAKKWDYIILQDQSQRPAFPPAQVQQDVIPYAAALDSIINANDICIETMFYMTWGRKYGDQANCPFYSPLCTYDSMQWRLRQTYLQLGQLNHAAVAPVGMAWKASRLADSTINLWATDNSHPSVAGSYLTACVFYNMIYKKRCSGSTHLGGLPANVASFLQNIADVTVFDSLSNWIGTGHSVYANGTVTDSSGYYICKGQGINGSSYHWDFGDGNSSTQQNPPAHQYAAFGAYKIVLTVGNVCDTHRFCDTAYYFAAGTGEWSNGNISTYHNGNQIIVRGADQQQLEIEVYSMTGQRLAIRRSFGQTHSVQLPLSKGVYLLKIRSDHEHWSSRVVVY